MTPRWRIRLLWGAVAVLLVSSVGAFYITEDASEVTVDAALQRFRAQQQQAVTGAEDSPAPPAPGEEAPAGPGPTPAAGPGRPEAAGGPAPAPSGRGERPVPTAPPQPGRASPEQGVYVYATEGYERTDALSGAHRQYPAETAVTLTRTPCGWQLRWQPLAERWDESEFCHEPGGVAIRRFTTYHEFFKRGDRQDFAFEPGNLVFPLPPEPGRTWTLSGRTSRAAIEFTARTVGAEEMVIGGQRVRAWHLHYDATMTGQNRGTQTQDRWVDETGRLLRLDMHIVTETDSPFGAVNYEERYSLKLTSLTPRQ